MLNPEGIRKSTRARWDYPQQGECRKKQRKEGRWMRRATLTWLMMMILR